MKSTHYLCSASLLSTLLFFGSPTFAQGNMSDKPDCGHERGWFKGKRQEHGPVGRIQHMLKPLDLTDEQRDKIETIIDTATPKFKGMMDEMQTQRKRLHVLAMADDFSADQVESAAEAQAQLMKQMILEGAQLRASVFDQLTSEQREEIKQHMQKRMDRFQ